MAERGYAGLSIAAVKKKSGLPSGSIYWHFESKEALLLSVIEQAAARWLEVLPDPSSLTVPPSSDSKPSCRPRPTLWKSVRNSSG